MFDPTHPGLRAIFVRHGLDLAYLFGSQAAGSARPESDVDIAVVFPAGVNAEARFEGRIALTEALESLLDKTVDVAVLNDCDNLLAQQAVAHGRLLYEDPVRQPAVPFAARTALRYADTAKFRRLSAEALTRHLSPELKAIRESRP
jgi:predicted nucleotidyltransferase